MVEFDQRSGQGKPAMIDGRIPPQALDVEQAVLGAMLIDKSAISKAIEILQPEHFYRESHREIYKTMLALFGRNEPADMITVTEELRRRGTLDSSGGPAFLAELAGMVTSAANIEYHARIVVEKAIKRELIVTSSEISSRAFSDQEDALQLLDEAERSIFLLSEASQKKRFSSMESLIEKTLTMLESIHGSHSGITGVGSGFFDLDNLTGGFQKSDLIIIAGRPSHGKTAFVLSVARNAAVEFEVPVAFFSLEMSEQQLALRLICAEARVDAHLVRTGRLKDDQWPKLTKRIGKLSKARIFIDDTPSLGILELRAKARRLKAEQNIGVVIVDYLQLMRGPRANMESREREISEISRSLKALAKDLEIPVIALSQLNRGLTNRPEKRPMLSDLRESGAIEQDADVVLFVHRPEMYDKESTLFDGHTPAANNAELIIGKQRNGPAGEIVILHFEHSYAKFENFSRFDEPPVREPVEAGTPF